MSVGVQCRQHENVGEPTGLGPSRTVTQRVLFRTGLYVYASSGCVRTSVRCPSCFTRCFLIAWIGIKRLRPIKHHTASQAIRRRIDMCVCIDFNMVVKSSPHDTWKHSYFRSMLIWICHFHRPFEWCIRTDSRSKHAVLAGGRRSWTWETWMHVVSIGWDENFFFNPSSHLNWEKCSAFCHIAITGRPHAHTHTHQNSWCCSLASPEFEQRTHANDRALGVMSCYGTLQTTVTQLRPLIFHFSLCYVCVSLKHFTFMYFVCSVLSSIFGIIIIVSNKTV